MLSGLVAAQDATLAASRTNAPLPEVGEAALILLHRLPFFFYAEDRNLRIVATRFP